MSLVIENEVDVKFDFDYEKLIMDVVNYALDYIKCPYESEVNVTLTNNEEIHKINNSGR